MGPTATRQLIAVRQLPRRACAPWLVLRRMFGWCDDWGRRRAGSALGSASDDATECYARGLSEVSFSTDRTVNEAPARVRNRVFVHTAEDMGEWPDDSVALR